MNTARGFTLIELMIVIAIIGILAAIAIPAYRDYVAKAQLGEALTLLTGKKTPMAEFYGEKGRWPGAVASVADQGSSGNFIATVSITEGAGGNTPVKLTALVRNNRVSALIAGLTMYLTSTSGSTWTCGSSEVPARLLPSACR